MIGKATCTCIFFLVLVFSEVFGYCPPRARYRTYDGSCNNKEHPTWGQADTAQRRLKDRYGRWMVDYADGKGLPRGYPNKLPGPREICNILTDMSLNVNNLYDKKKSGECMAFGQLLAHDIIETKIPQGIDCCRNPKSRNLDICFPFYIAGGDGHLPAGCKNFIRSSAAVQFKDNYRPVYREQVNLISSLIDASFLYGISKDQVNSLRESNSYLMKTDRGNLLPTTDGGGCYKIDKVKDRCPMAGDIRSSESANLGLNHLLFVREHNRIATQIHNVNPGWTNEKTFQETRRIIIAIVQHITYNHFLPSIIDKNTMTKYNLFSKTTGYNYVYNKNVDPSITNGFGAAAWRYGHSQVMPMHGLLEDDFQTEKGVFKIEDNFQSPHLWQEDYGKNIQSYARWLTVKPAQKIDNYLVDGLRDKLFTLINSPGSDLFSLNIQRGRDQGVPGFNRWREYCGFRKFYSFIQFGKCGTKLAKIYKSVHDVDFFVGGLCEHGPDFSIGATFACVIGKQFQLLKTGDRYWYESSDPEFAFTTAQLNSIKKASSLSKILCTNFGLKVIGEDIFYIPSDATNPLLYCEDLQDIDFTLWKDGTTQSGHGGYLSGSTNKQIKSNNQISSSWKTVVTQKNYPRGRWGKWKKMRGNFRQRHQQVRFPWKKSRVNFSQRNQRGRSWRRNRHVNFRQRNLRVRSWRRNRHGG